MLCHTKKNVREHDWDVCPKLALEILCTIDHHAQYIKWESYLEEGLMKVWDRVRHWSVGGKQFYRASLVFP